MHTPLNFRLAVAVASITITFSLLSGIAALAKPPVASVQMAQAATAMVR
jgi:hypothetical protein